MRHETHAATVWDLHKEEPNLQVANYHLDDPNIILIIRRVTAFSEDNGQHYETRTFRNVELMKMCINKYSFCVRFVRTYWKMIMRDGI